MKRQFRLISALIIAGLAIISQTSCKEHTLIDAKVAPNIDNIHVFQTDTFTILTKTVMDDSLETSSSISGVSIFHGLGFINGSTNPTFGSTSEGIYLQVIPETLGPTFLTTDVVDSTTLILPYASYSFGNVATTQPQSFKVYRITDPSFSIANGYQAVNPVSYDQSTVLGSLSNVNMQNLIKDSAIVDGLAREPMLRIKLNMQNGTPFFDTMLLANQQSDIPSFLNAFNGLYIMPDTSLSTDLIPYFQLDGVDTYSRAAILVYHHNPSTAGEQIFQYYFDIQTCAHYNRITRNYSGYPAQLLASKNASDTVALIQGLPGMAIDVKIPFLSNAFDASKFKFIINSAQLVITQMNASPLTNSIFTPQVKMTVTGVGGQYNDSLYVIADSYPITSPYALQFIDGNARQVTIGSSTTNQYKLNMPREVMESIAQKRTLHVRINGTIDYPGAMQTVVGGGNNPNSNYKMKLNVVYTKI